VIQADVTDAGGVTQVKFMVDYNGSWHDLYVDTNGGDGWKYDKNIHGGPTIPDQENVKVRVEARDSVGNTAGTEKIGIRIDNTPPAASLVTTSPYFFTTVTAQVQVNDLGGSGIAHVDFKFNDGTTEYTVTDNNGSNGWQVTWNVPGTPTTIRVLAWVYDYAGNGIQTGQVTLARDASGPSINIHYPTEGQLLFGLSSIRAVVSDPAGVDRVIAYIYYKERAADAARIRHDFPLVRQTGEIWELAYDFSRVMAQHDAFVEFVAFDRNGNQSQAIKHFSIMVKDLTIVVDARKQWSDQNTVWTDVFPVLWQSTVNVSASGTVFASPNNPYSPTGNGTVCLFDCQFPGPYLGLGLRYNRSNGSSASFAFSGSSYQGFAAQDGYFRFGFNDRRNSFYDNSGFYQVLLTVYPPYVQTVATTTLSVTDKGASADGICPHVQVWIESQGSIKMVNQFETCTSTYTAHNVNLPTYLLVKPYAIWLYYDNNRSNTGDRNYYVQSISINGVTKQVTDPGVDYYTGDDPFAKLYHRPGRPDMNWGGAQRFALP
jgi:hypothetical protein